MILSRFFKHFLRNPKYYISQSIYCLIFTIHKVKVCGKMTYVMTGHGLDIKAELM